MSTEEKLTAVAANVPKVYKAGKDQQRNDFWDSVQDFGNRTDYEYSFAGKSWTSDNFYPKYDMIIGTNTDNFRQMFYHSSELNIDLAERLEECGVVLDTSGAKTFYNTFRNAAITRLPVLNSQNTSELYATFGGGWLVTIDKLILKSDGTQSFTSTFYGCTSLKNIVVEGTIGNDFDIHWSPLTKASFTSIVNALSGTAEGKTVSFSQAAKEAVFTEEEWAALIGAKSNWTIALS